MSTLFFWGAVTIAFLILVAIPAWIALKLSNAIVYRFFKIDSTNNPLLGGILFVAIMVTLGSLMIGFNWTTDPESMKFGIVNAAGVCCFVIAGGAILYRIFLGLGVSFELAIKKIRGD